jgi:hypothetical protein
MKQVTNDQIPDLPTVVFGHWIHSHEEDEGGVEVYRPEGFGFPASRGRTGFEMSHDGRFIQDDIGPGDGKVQVSGRWTVAGPRRIAVSFPGTARSGYSLEVLAVDESVFRCRREPSDLLDSSLHGECRDWAAFVDRQPPGPPRLHVHGDCEFPTSGVTVELRRHEPPGSNPRDLLLDKIVHGPAGPTAQVITRVGVHYDEETSADLDTVTLLPDGVSIPVTEVS